MLNLFFWSWFGFWSCNNNRWSKTRMPFKKSYVSMVIIICCGPFGGDGFVYSNCIISIRCHNMLWWVNFSLDFFLLALALSMFNCWDSPLSLSLNFFFFLNFDWQLLDLPGIIEGAKDGKGRGRQVKHFYPTWLSVIICWFFSASACWLFYYSRLELITISI